MAQFKIFNGPMPTSAAQAHVATGTNIKTLQQIKGRNRFKVIEWGVSFSAAAIAATVKCELLTTGDISATVTAAVAAGIVAWDKQALDATITPADRLTLGTGATGYTASVEGTIVATRTLDALYVPPAGFFTRRFDVNPPLVDAAEYLRVRVHSPADYGAISYVIIEV